MFAHVSCSLCKYYVPCPPIWTSNALRPADQFGTQKECDYVDQDKENAWILTMSATGLRITRLLFSVDMPDNIVRQTNNFIACSLGHFRETLCLRLVLECIAGEIDTCTYYC